MRGVIYGASKYFELFKFLKTIFSENDLFSFEI